MRLAITATLGDQPRVWPLEGACVRIGRDRSNDVQIRAPSVSREHAEIVDKGDRLLLRDLRSRNGTWVNGVPVRRPVQVRAGDSIQVGRVSLHLTERPANHQGPLSDSSTLTTTIEVPLPEILGHGPGIGAAPDELVRLLESVGHLLVQHRSLQYTCDAFLRQVEMALPTSRLVLLLRESPGGEPTQVAARCRGPRAEEPLVLSNAALQAALLRRTAVVTSHPAEGGRVEGATSAGAGRGRPAVVVPLLHEGEALGLLYADHDDPDFRYGRENLAVLTLFANMAAARVAIEKLVDVEKKTAKIERELAMASRIQHCLLPAQMPSVAGYEFHSWLESCEEVGGDFFDIQTMPDGTVWFMLGDVSGKGICAAILMALCLSTARVLYDLCGDPGVLATRLNALLSQRTDTEHFVSAVIGRLTPATGTLRYVNAGHPAPVLMNGPAIQRLCSTGAVLGVLPEFDYEDERVSLAPRALLALFTDGVPEARRGKEFFGDRRVASAIEEAARHESLEEAGRSIFQKVDGFLSGRPRKDDIALLLVRRDAPERRMS